MFHFTDVMGFRDTNIFIVSQIVTGRLCTWILVYLILESVFFISSTLPSRSSDFLSTKCRLFFACGHLDWRVYVGFSLPQFFSFYWDILSFLFCFLFSFIFISVVSLSCLSALLSGSLFLLLWSQDRKVCTPCWELAMLVWSVKLCFLLSFILRAASFSLQNMC